MENRSTRNDSNNIDKKDIIENIMAKKMMKNQKKIEVQEDIIIKIKKHLKIIIQV